jgi:hypothetical protein
MNYWNLYLNKNLLVALHLSNLIALKTNQITAIKHSFRSSNDRRVGVNSFVCLCVIYMLNFHTDFRDSSLCSFLYIIRLSGSKLFRTEQQKNTTHRKS